MPCLIFKASIIYGVFFVTSLYVPSGLHTGTKTCGKSFLACCSVYFFSATHLDVSEEHHKSPESLHITEAHEAQLNYFLMLGYYETNILKKSVEDVESHR